MVDVLGPSTAQNRPAKAVEDIYQKKTQLEHILLRPDTYVGSIEHQQQTLWVHDGEQMQQRSVSFVPGLYKIFDEILVNAADNKVRDPSMSEVRVDVDRDRGRIRIWNNGSGVPVEMHKKEHVYVPELIFGHLLTSSNYEDAQKKVTGGRNGYGAKLANIFSTEFIIETCDGTRQRRYRQVFNDNMGKKSSPKITACKASDNWTAVEFAPDFARFGMEGLEDDTVALMRKRTYDLSGVLGSSVKVFYNGQRLPIKTFKDYVNLYLGPKEGGAPRVHEKVGDRWEVVVSPTEGQFQQVSFVNSICTLKGGTHVKLVLDQLCKNLTESINKKSKGANVKDFMVKNHLWIFVNCQIVNPAFDSQTKETLTLKASSFGSKCELSSKFIDAVGKSGVSDSILAYASFKKNKELKKTDGAKTSRLHGIPKLDDANDAGGRNSDKCTLILTEGDSAKTLAISGLSIVGRDKYGVFPLRGKLLNVRDATSTQVNNNAEITALKQIIGLQHGKQYADVKSLRYGKVMIMTDQDQDGSHIKGLIMNYLHHFYPSLLRVPGFLVEFITPIVKATKGRQTKTFYTLPEYEEWKEGLGNNLRGWAIKYYKGLGTSTTKEAKEYFAELETHRKRFVWHGDEDGESIELAFSKKKVDARKQWLREFVPGTYLDHAGTDISYSDFVHRELILFSRADLERSIPSMLDGLKPGQRKIMYCCFKRNLKNDVKVAQLSGYVAEHSAYHHGEVSLQNTIVGLAQDFVGSNNVNLLVPSGQFGTRLQGGKDSASARYIFTRLAPLARHLFNEDDDALLQYQSEEGQTIEPVWYLPILPLVLVNGADGIGTGWSTSIPNYNPVDIVRNIRRLLRGEPTEEMEPWYRGFRGEIFAIPAARSATGCSFQISGIIDQAETGELSITELPVRKWTQDYKEFLDSMVKPEGKTATPLVHDYKEHHTDASVHFRVQLTEAGLQAAQDKGLTTFFKLQTRISTSNMMLFNKEGVITKYESPDAVLRDFCALRLEYYERRRQHLLARAQRQLQRISNKVRFILAVIDNEVIVSSRRKAAIEGDLERLGFDRMPRRDDGPKRGVAAAASAADAEDDGEDDAAAGGLTFDYLLGMAISTLTLEKVEALKSDETCKQAEVARLNSESRESLWLQDLDAFEAAYAMWLEEEDAAAAQAAAAQLRAQRGAAPKGKVAAKRAPAQKKKKARASSDEDSESAGESGGGTSEDEYAPAPKRKAAAKQTTSTKPPPSTAAPTLKGGARIAKGSGSGSKGSAAKRGAPQQTTLSGQAGVLGLAASAAPAHKAKALSAVQAVGPTGAAQGRGTADAEPTCSAPAQPTKVTTKPATQKAAKTGAPVARAKRKPAARKAPDTASSSDGDDSSDAEMNAALTPSIAPNSKVRRMRPSPFHKASGRAPPRIGSDGDSSSNSDGEAPGASRRAAPKRAAAAAPSKKYTIDLMSSDGEGDEADSGEERPRDSDDDDFEPESD